MSDFAYGFLAGIGAVLSLGSVGWLLSCALWKWQHDKRQRSWVPGPQRASVTSDGPYYTRCTEWSYKSEPEQLP